jgi:predicted Fe-S protein YdhL (DUF1289 family)
MLYRRIDMWSLPDIEVMNANAAGHAAENRWEVLIGQGLGADGEPAVCECADWSGPECAGELRATLWYDIFSDDPKGLLWLCEQHDHYYGSPVEGYFYCDGCERTLIENYTWETYYRVVDDGEIYCLNCARELYLQEDKNWLELNGRALVRLRRRLRTGKRLERKAPHLFAVGQEAAVEEAGLKFLGNVEFDSLSGAQLYGGDGTQELFELLRGAARSGYQRAVLIIDAAYQFAVSVGVYVESPAPREEGAVR